MTLRAHELTRVVAGRTLFSSLDLEVQPGQCLVVSGPSGIGKSVLLRALAWLDPIQAGAVSLGGRSPAEWGVPEWRRRVSYVAQTPPILPGTPAEWWRVLGGLEYRRELELASPWSMLPAWGLDESLRDQTWASLSVGERQRVHLAIALGSRPDVLLLDEPTSALDPCSTEAVEASLVGRTTVWVTHDPNQADRVADVRLQVGTGS
ncbi:MAG: ABC transporter ATP-binding protein [Myxococcota bacterium]|nr:ABC transporter ATP-binding protein [Myxococcota bacterium]